MLVADIAQIDADAGFAVEQLTQLRDRKTVAGVNPDHTGTLMQERLDLGGEFLRQIFKLRTEPRLHALAGPDQFFAEGRQGRALAATGFHQRNTEEIRPLLDQVPDMAIRQMRMLGGAGEFASFADLVEDPEHHDSGLRAPFLVETPHGLDLDVVHDSLGVMKLTPYIYDP